MASRLFSPALRANMMLEVARVGYAEVAWVCFMDPVERRVTSARAVTWGSREETFFLPVDLPAAGELTLLVHNHPRGQPTAPSSADLTVAQGFAAQGVGFAIVSYDLSQCFMVRQPESADAILARRARPIARRRSRCLTLGPLMLVWTGRPSSSIGG
jgi:hypothetical protein